MNIISRLISAVKSKLGFKSTKDSQSITEPLPPTEVVNAVSLEPSEPVKKVRRPRKPKDAGTKPADQPTPRRTRRKVSPSSDAKQAS